MADMEPKAGSVGDKNQSELGNLWLSDLLLSMVWSPITCNLFIPTGCDGRHGTEGELCG